MRVPRLLLNSVTACQGRLAVMHPRVPLLLPTHSTVPICASASQSSLARVNRCMNAVLHLHPTRRLQGEAVKPRSTAFAILQCAAASFEYVPSQQRADPRPYVPTTTMTRRVFLPARLC